MNRLLFFSFFIVFLLGVIYSQQRVVYFYFQDQFLVLYADEHNKLFVDLNSGFVIKPEEQERKIRFVEYVLNVQSFVSRDEDVFTKVYVLKKTIGFNFDEVEPTNLDYYSWGPLTYKYLAIFCKRIDESITIRIPSFDQLSKEDKREIIDRYRLVFGTTFNEPRYLPYDITFKNVAVQKNDINKQQLYTTETIYNASQNTALNPTTMNFTVIPTTSSPPENPRGMKNVSVFYMLPVLIGVIILGSILFRKQFKKQYDYGYEKNELIIQISEHGKNISSVQKEVENLKQRSESIESRLNELFQRVNEISEKIEMMYKKYEEESRKSASLDDFSSDNFQEVMKEGESKAKPLDKENLEMIMFRIDVLTNKIKSLEIYKEMDIAYKAGSVASELYNFKAKVRKNKSISFSEWDSIVKNLIIDLISTLDKYTRKFGDNENIKRIRKEIMDECEIEELHIVPEKTKVNVIDHRVEGYVRNPNLQNGVIVEVKEEGYKYKGITVKRAKVIENRI